MPYFLFNGPALRIVAMITAYSSNLVNERLNFDNNLIKTEASMHFIASNIGISHSYYYTFY